MRRTNENSEREECLSLGRRESGVFSALHPAVCALYFLFVLLFLMFVPHPLLQALGLLGGCLFAGLTQGVRRMGRILGWVLSLAALAALTNPLFSAEGETVLFSFGSLPITRESLLYGCQTALMLMAVIVWFSCLNEVMTTDKWIFLFGKAAPKVSLVLVMAMRFLPLFLRKWKEIRLAQKALGYTAGKSAGERAVRSVRTFGALLSWAFENAMDTATSMQARGYGLPGRTQYSLYRFTRRDGTVLGVLLLAGAGVIASLAADGLAFSYFPTCSSLLWNAPACMGYGCMAVLCFLPGILEGTEVLVWRCLQSKM